GCWSICRIGCETSSDDVSDGRIELRIEGGPPHFGAGGRDGIRRKEFRPDEHLVQHETERVEIRLHGHAPAGELLWRHVSRRSSEFMDAHFARNRQTEIHDPNAAATVDHDVSRLEISMKDALVVRRRQSRAELPRYIDCLFARQSTDAPKKG